MKPLLADLLIQVNLQEHLAYLDKLKKSTARLRSQLKKVDPVCMRVNACVIAKADLDYINNNSLGRILKQAGYSEAERKKPNFKVIEVLNSRVINGY